MDFWIFVLSVKYNDLLPLQPLALLKVISKRTKDFLVATRNALSRSAAMRQKICDEEHKDKEFSKHCTYLDLLDLSAVSSCVITDHTTLGN